MTKFLCTIGEYLAAMSSMILNSATLGMNGEVEPPKCLK